MTVKPWRFCSTILLLGASLALASCGKDSSEEPPDPPSAKDVAELIEQEAVGWLDDLQDPADKPLVCPGQQLRSFVTSSDESVRACPWSDATSTYFMRVQNLSDVPMSVWGEPAELVFTVQPGSFMDIQLTNPQFGQTLSFKADAVAGLTAVVMDQMKSQIVDKKTGGLSWTACVADPSQACVLDSLASLLPERVRIGRFNVPIQDFTQGLAFAYTQRDLIGAFADKAGSSEPGLLTIQDRQATVPPSG